MATQSTVAGQDGDFENSKARINSSSGNGSGPATKGSAATSSALARRSTGPRTKKGKEKSKHNALKHGILSAVTLLKGEPRKEFDSLLNGFRNDFRPEGQVEALLVEKLASLVWRYRRMLIAETAEVEKGTRFNWWEKSERVRQEAAIFLGSEGKMKGGLFFKVTNPLIRERCINLLKILKASIEFIGFNASFDARLFSLLFGDAKMDPVNEPLLAVYGLCSSKGEIPDIKELNLASATPDARKAKFLELLQVEIDRLQQLQESLDRITGPKEKLELLCRNVPEGPKLDQLLRYEANLDRSFDRTLVQLERLQRMRLGHPVSPSIDVNVTSS